MVTGTARSGVIGRFLPPPLKFPVDVKVMENDPGMSIKVTGRQVSIRGTATNNGIAASFAQFEVAGQKINLDLSRGQQPEQVLAALARRLPDGHSIQGTADDFQIMRGGSTRKPSTVEQIRTIFANAMQASSPGKGLVTTSELRAAFKVGHATAGKLSQGEKLALAQSWAGTFTGAGFLATPAAQKEYRRLAEKHQLPTIPIF